MSTTESYDVRTLTSDDLDAIVRIDAAGFGRARPEYFKQKLRAALQDTGVRVSLAAEHDGAVVGFLLASIYYGDYGQPEPTATLEAIGVHPDFARRGVGTALWEQLALNLKAMRVDRVQTQVSWDNGELLAFLRRTNFRLSQRVCLERKLDFESDG